MKAIRKSPKGSTTPGKTLLGARWPAGSEAGVLSEGVPHWPAERENQGTDTGNLGMSQQTTTQTKRETYSLSSARATESCLATSVTRPALLAASVHTCVVSQTVRARVAVRENRPNLNKNTSNAALTKSDTLVQANTWHLTHARQAACHGSCYGCWLVPGTLQAAKQQRQQRCRAGIRFCVDRAGFEGLRRASSNGILVHGWESGREGRLFTGGAQGASTPGRRSLGSAWDRVLSPALAGRAPQSQLVVSGCRVQCTPRCRPPSGSRGQPLGVPCAVLAEGPKSGCRHQQKDGVKMGCTCGGRYGSHEYHGIERQRSKERYTY